VERKDSDDCVSAGRRFEVNGVRDKGRGKKTWDECEKKDLVEFGLHGEWALERVRWRVSHAETVHPVLALTTDIKRR